MCRWFRLLTLIMVVTLLTLVAVEAFAQPVSLVRVEEVRYEPLTQTVPVIGRLVARRAGNVASRIAGPIDKIFVEIGDQVKAGQVIAILNSETFSADQSLAQGELKEARADLKNWKAEAEISRVELNRQKRLKKSTAFSQAKYEDALKKVAAADAKVKRAEAKVIIKEAALHRRQLDVEYARIRAPYTSVVVQRFTEAGAYVKSGDPIVKLISDQSLEVEADVPFKRISGLTKGRTLSFTLDDGTKHSASVRAVLPSENPLTRTRTMRLSPKFEKNKGQLAEGQSVTVAVPVGAPRKVLVVHKDAILKRGGSDLVFIIEKGVANSRPIKLGQSVGNKIEVLGGLKEGELVVIRGNERLRPGAKVRIEKGSS